MPSTNPQTGMPRLRRGWGHARTRNPVFPSHSQPTPGVDYTSLSFGAGGAVPMPTSSVQISSGHIAANPRVRSQAQTYCAGNIGQGWSLVLNVGGVPTKAYKATESGQKQQYGQIWHNLKVSPRADLPNGFQGWVPRCGATERLGKMRNPACHEGGVVGNPACHEGGVVGNPVSVGACFPKFDPLEMYQVGRPSPAPNMASMQAQSQLPVIDPYTGMPRRRRSRMWGR